MTVQSKSERYIGLDGLRGILMSWGIIVHTSTLGFSPFFHDLTAASGYFRMATFFCISGFLSKMLSVKYGIIPTIRKRTISIGVPLLTGLLILNPATLYLVFKYHNPDSRFIDYIANDIPGMYHGPMVWHLHLWFLVTLLVFSLCIPIFVYLANLIEQLVHDRLNSKGPSLLFTILCFCLTASCLASRFIFKYALEDFTPISWHYIVRSSLFNAPYYLIGMCIFTSIKLKESFCKLHPAHFIISIICVLVAEHLSPLAIRPFGEAAKLASNAYVGITSASTLFFLFEKVIPPREAFFKLMSESSYSVYIFHYLIIYIMATFLSPYGWSLPSLMCTVATGTLAVTLTLHLLVIRRSKILSLLFNGKILKTKASAL